MEIPAGALSQIVINLVNNALIHAFEPATKGQMHIDVDSPSSDRVEIHFSDNGKGMSSDEVHKVFEKYYTTKGDCGGSGLGMYIVKKAVEGPLQGRISFSSEIGSGTKFTLHLPKVVEKE